MTSAIEPCGTLRVATMWESQVTVWTSPITSTWSPSLPPVATDSGVGLLPPQATRAATIENRASILKGCTALGDVDKSVGAAYKNYGMNVRSVNQRKRGRPLVDDKRRLILDAALEVFAERGF